MLGKGLEGADLLSAVAVRIIAAHLQLLGHTEIRVIPGRHAANTARGTDLTYRGLGRTLQVKVRPDAYFGTDQTKVRDRALTFYRADEGDYAFEAVADATTRSPGWMFSSPADELFYYFLVLLQTEEEVAAIIDAPDHVFFTELRVERDDLRILSMPEAQAWFQRSFEKYPPRPAKVGTSASWLRLVPREDLEAGVSDIRAVGPIFHQLAL